MVVRDVGGIHAQVASAAELSLAARVDGIRRDDLHRALWEERALVKTWSIRGTLHLHAADELQLWTAAQRAVPSEWWTSAEIGPEEAQAAVDAVVEALDGHTLLRRELADEVGRRVGEWARGALASGWGFLVSHAALEGRVVHGPPTGTKVTFVRADQWLPPAPAPEPEDALLEVCRRFLRTSGPGTPRTFSDWFSPRLPPATGRALFDALEPELREVDIEGRAAWALGEPAWRGRPAGQGLRLLPEYDCYVMGFRERDVLLPERARAVVAAHGKGRLEGPGAVPWLLVDGRVAGTWRRERRGRRITIRVEPFARLSAARRRELEDEVARIGAFLGADPVLALA